MTETKEQEQVVMTPKGKTANSTTILIERRVIQKTNEKMHVAGGEHTGIVINKEAVAGKWFFLILIMRYAWFCLSSIRKWRGRPSATLPRVQSVSSQLANGQTHSGVQDVALLVQTDKTGERFCGSGQRRGCAGLFPGAGQSAGVSKR